MKNQLLKLLMIYKINIKKKWDRLKKKCKEKKKN